MNMPYSLNSLVMTISPLHILHIVCTLQWMNMWQVLTQREKEKEVKHIQLQVLKVIFYHSGWFDLRCMQQFSGMFKTYKEKRWVVLPNINLLRLNEKV